MNAETGQWITWGLEKGSGDIRWHLAYLGVFQQEWIVHCEELSDRAVVMVWAQMHA